ncbi:MAG: glycosyltransferase family 1 protein [Acidobacteria bacterium]|nr:MAG: glycosyltransferase family 1 protein [Acidobacteriota bacterium]
MQILVISNLFPPDVLGGYEILCQHVVDELSARGHDVHVLTAAGALGEKTPSLGLDPETHVHRGLELQTPFPDAPKHLRRLRRRVGKANASITRATIAKFRPDVIFLWSQLRLTVGPARAAEASQVAVVYAINDEHLAGYAPSTFDLSAKGIARYIIDNVLMRDITLHALRLRKAAIISRCLKGKLASRGVAAEAAAVIYQGIPIERFPVKEEIGKLHDPVRLLYTGQLHPYKGVHTLIDAAHALASNASLPAIRVTLVGAGSSTYEDTLRRLAASGPAAVRFTGRKSHEELPAIYRDHDLFAFPSIWEEPFGLTQLEAMASGLPVVSTANGGQGEVLRHGDNALLFQPGDAAGLAESLGTLIRDGGLRTRLAKTARDEVAKHFTVRRYARQLEDLLELSIKEVAQ